MLLALSTLGFVVAAFLIWYVPSVGLKSIHPLLPHAAGVVVLLITAFMLFGVLAVSVTLIRGGGRYMNPRFRGLLIKLFFPVMLIVGGLFKVKRIKIEKAFLEVNNGMVRQLVRDMVRKGKRLTPDKILILMPHCIQYDDCRLKVTRDVKNCAGCGKCEIGDLLVLTEKYGMELFVLTGGTVARRRLAEFRPKAVVAVACERDLTSGIQDAFPLPVLAIVNKRPHGYCVDTGVAVEDIKEAIEDLVGGGEVVTAA